VSDACEEGHDPEPAIGAVSEGVIRSVDRAMVRWLLVSHRTAAA
jgi:hypothetical protein